MKNWVIPAFIGAGMLITSCNSLSNSKVKEAEIENIPVVAVLQKDTLYTTAYVAEIQAHRFVEMRAKVGGFLENIFVDEGAKVKKGQLLFQLNQEAYKSDFAKAMANLSNAEAEAMAAELEVDRVKVLVNKNVISKTELDLAKSRKKAAEAKIAESKSLVETSKIHLNQTGIKAPFDGYINRIPLKMGSLIEEGTLLTFISDDSKVNAYFNLSELDYLAFKKKLNLGENNSGKYVSLVLADGSIYPLKGLIETMESQIDESTGSLAFRAKFENPQGLLKHGSTGKILVSHELEGVLLIPQKSVFEIQDKSYVYVVLQDNTLKSKQVVIQQRIGDYYVITSGLKSGDRIVFEGIQQVKEGQKINPVSKN